MKKILFSLSAIFSLALFSHIGLSADLVLPAPAANAARGTPELLAQARAAQAPPLQLAAIGETREIRSAGLQDVTAADKAAVEGLPSTPIALATLLLVICILIGRRNS